MNTRNLRHSHSRESGNPVEKNNLRSSQKIADVPLRGNFIVELDSRFRGNEKAIDFYLKNLNILHAELADFSHSIIHDATAALGFAPSPRYTIETGLEVYRNNYRGNLHDALAGAYPVIGQLVGTDFLRMLSRDFISQHGSRSANLFDYGAQLGDFLVTYEPAHSLAYLADMARLEWACHRAYFATDSEPLELARLAQIVPADYANLRLHVHSACHIIASKFPIVAIWQAHQTEASFEIDWSYGGEIGLVMRQDDTVKVHELIKDEAHWLVSIMHGESLGLATAATLKLFPNFNLQDTMQLFASLGILTDFTLGEIACKN